jgi:hypothetical protein
MLLDLIMFVGCTSLYGLKQAPRAWYQRFASYIVTLGFTAFVTVTSLFVLSSGSDTAYLLLYVDNIIVTASSTAAASSHPLSHFFLDIAVRRTSDIIFLSQR